MYHVIMYLFFHTVRRTRLVKNTNGETDTLCVCVSGERGFTEFQKWIQHGVLLTVLQFFWDTLYEVLRYSNCNGIVLIL